MAAWILPGNSTAGNSSSTITGDVNYTSPSNSTFGGIIAGSGKTLTLNNPAATLILTGANTYTGGTNNPAGTLQIGNGGTTGNLGPGTMRRQRNTRVQPQRHHNGLE